MIRINLLGEKTDKSAVYTLQLLAYAAAIAVTVATCFFYHSGELLVRDSFQRDKDQLEKQLAVLLEKTKKVEGLAQKKHKLEEKQNALRLLKARKQVPVRLLDQITSAIPTEAWLSAIEEKAGIMKFEGVALDNQTISKFMDRLEQTELLSNVELNVTKQMEEKGAQVMQFTLSAKVEDPITFAAVQPPAGPGAPKAPAAAGSSASAAAPAVAPAPPQAVQLTPAAK